MNSTISGIKSTISNAGPRLTNISIDGIEVTFNNEVFQLPYARYPWFRHCSASELENITFDGSALEWPDAVIDLELDLIRHPEKEGEITSVANWLMLRARVRKKETARKTVGNHINRSKNHRTLSPLHA